MVKVYDVRVEQDDIAPGRWMVVLYSEKKIIGVPLRGASRKQADDSLEPVRYAFEFGWLACDSTTREFMRTTWIQVRKVTDEEKNP